MMGSNINRELRFLVTQQCNYKCLFCHGEGLQSNKINKLTPDDIAFLFYIAKKYYDIKTATLTGGEPLLRADIIDIVDNLYDMGCYITITTNGYLLNKYFELGKYVSCINVSLHTLSKEAYEHTVQRVDSFDRVTNNLEEFKLKYPNVEICLNITLIENLNSSEKQIHEIINFAKNVNANLKFIELYPSNSNGFVPIEVVKNYLIKNGFQNFQTKTRNEKYFDKKTVVGLSKIFCSIAQCKKSPSEYCNSTNDLFISPDGKIKPCRNNTNEIDILKCVHKKNEIMTKHILDQAFNELGKNCIYE